MQLKPGGFMIFIVTSTKMDLYRSGKFLSKDRYEISKGLKVFFYNKESIKKEFSPFGMLEYKDIKEPVKYMKDQDPIKLIWVICKKK